MRRRPVLRTYPAELLGVYDADSFTLRLDLGMGFFRRTRVRLYGVDAFERRGGTALTKQAAALGRGFTERVLRRGSQLIFRYRGEEKYGRDLGDMVVDGADLAQALVDARLAVWYDGGNRALLSDKHNENLRVLLKEGYIFSREVPPQDAEEGG